MLARPHRRLPVESCLPVSAAEHDDGGKSARGRKSRGQTGSTKRAIYTLVTQADCLVCSALSLLYYRLGRVR